MQVIEESREDFFLEMHTKRYYFSGANEGFLGFEKEKEEEIFFRGEQRDPHKRGATLTHKRQIFSYNRGEFLK